jgi:hypothetical protein
MTDRFCWQIMDFEARRQLFGFRAIAEQRQQKEAA